MAHPTKLAFEAGTRFGDWTVVREAENCPHNYSQSLCRCSCGELRTVRNTVLQRGKSLGCGHARHEAHRARAEATANEAVGQTLFGWTVLNVVGRNQHLDYVVTVRCQCGFVKRAVLYEVRKDKTKRCRQCREFGAAKLTRAQAEEIMALALEGRIKQVEIGKMFGVSQGTVANIKRGFIWKDAA